MDISFKNYIDSNKMVGGYRTHNSGNGLYYTAVAMNTMDLNPQHTYKDFTPKTFAQLFESCFQNGVLYRTPKREYGKESWDNYLGCIVGFLLTNDTKNARRLLWSVVKKFFYVDGNFLGRFPHIWILLAATCIPGAKYLLSPFLHLTFVLQNPSNFVSIKPNGSALQLQWMIVSVLNKLFPEFNYYSKWLNKFKAQFNDTEIEIFIEYYGPTHPIVQSWK